MVRKLTRNCRRDPAHDASNAASATSAMMSHGTGSSGANRTRKALRSSALWTNASRQMATHKRWTPPTRASLMMRGR